MVGVTFETRVEPKAHAGSIPAASAALDAAAADTLARPAARETPILEAAARDIALRPDGRASRSAKRTAPNKAAVRRRWVRPVGGPITSGYGWRWGRMHRGLDFAGAWGSPIYAAADGVISFAGLKGGYGNMIVIDHGGGLQTAYGHMSAIVLDSGPVRAGTLIGRIGSTGHSTGPHLHFEVRINEQAINPWGFLISHGVPL